MAKADYTYELKDFAGHSCIFIKDQNLGKMSLTNNIDEVVFEIEQKEKINADDSIVIYQDSEGLWDGYDVKTNNFISLDAGNQFHAARRYAKRLNAKPAGGDMPEHINMIDDPKDGGETTTEETTTTETTTTETPAEAPSTDAD